MDNQPTPSDGLEQFSRITTIFGKATYFVISLTLVVIAFGVIGFSLKEVWNSFANEAKPIPSMLDAVALTVLGLAVIDVAKYLLDEEVVRSRELRATSEARAALTKFLTIVTIAVSLEAIVLIFDANKRNQYEVMISAATLLFAVVAIVVGLGLYQWLSAKTEALTGPNAPAAKD